MIATDLLASLPLFAGVDAAQLARIAAVTHARVLEPGACVIREAEPMPPYFHAVIAGTMQILKSAHSGKETTLRLVRPGEIFAWAALLDGGDAPATARAMVRCRILMIPHAAMMALLAQEPALAVRLLATLCERLRDTHEQLHAVVSERARTRLARLIIRHQLRDGASPTPLPHQVLSRMAGIAYEESVRIIGEWSHGPRPLLSYGRGGRITVLDREALAAIAEGLELATSRSGA
jgi:CRP-like cAMP-binding protein